MRRRANENFTDRSIETTGNGDTVRFKRVFSILIQHNRTGASIVIADYPWVARNGRQIGVASKSVVVLPDAIATCKMPTSGVPGSSTRFEIGPVQGNQTVPG